MAVANDFFASVQLVGDISDRALYPRTGDLFHSFDIFELILFTAACALPV